MTFSNSKKKTAVSKQDKWWFQVSAPGIIGGKYHLGEEHFRSGEQKPRDLKNWISTSNCSNQPSACFKHAAFPLFFEVFNPGGLGMGKSLQTGGRKWCLLESTRYLETT